MSLPNLPRPLDDERLDHLRRLLKVYGVRATARACGKGRQRVLFAAAGLALPDDERNEIAQRLERLDRLVRE